MKITLSLATACLSLLATGALCSPTPPQPQQTQPAPSLTNRDVLEMLKAGLSPEIIVAKISASSCSFDTSPGALSALKAGGAPDAVILAMIQASSPGKPPQAAAPAARHVDELTALYKKLQNSVVTVWSEIGHGTGFIVDAKGLILTNQHVLGPSELVSVQFDPKLKVRAVLLAADPEKDIAVLWANLQAFPRAVVAPIAPGDSGQPPVVEGERVFTIGSPLSQRKILTTGTASKVEPRAIISDININPGNSGGPLFNSLGQVVGLTTFGEREGAGPGIAGVVRIEQALPLLGEARAKLAAASGPPSPARLPVEPVGTFPLQAIKEAAAERKFDTRPYIFSEGDYNVAVITPVLKYWAQNRSEVAEAREKAKRTRNKRGAVQGTFKPLENLKGWAEHAGEYQPVVQIQAEPKLRETFWSALGRGLAASGGHYGGPAKMRFKTDFYRMRLLCGSKDIDPIHPSKAADRIDVHTPFVNVTDATYVGFYTYPPEAISPACGTVALELYSEKSPEKPTVKVLSTKTVERIWADFAPYRDAAAKQSPAK